MPVAAVAPVPTTVSVSVRAAGLATGTAGVSDEPPPHADRDKAATKTAIRGADNFMKTSARMVETNSPKMFPGGLETLP